MESNEEKLHKMIIQSKINETKDVMKRKAMEIDKSKLSEAKVSFQRYQTAAAARTCDDDQSLPHA